MSPTTRLLPLSAGAVLLYDATASALSRLSGITYVDFSIGSLLIYFTIGVVASRWQVNAAVAGAVAGFTDATLGWLISAAIGPGRIPHTLTITYLVITVFAVTLSAVILAALGYLLESRLLYRIWTRN